MAKRKKRNGYVFRPSFAKFIELLPEDQQLEAFWAITNYGLYGETPKNGNIVMLMEVTIVREAE